MVHNSGGQKVKIKVWQGFLLERALRKILFYASLLTSGGFQAIWWLLACSCITLISALAFLWCLCVSLSSNFLPLEERTPVIMNLTVNEIILIWLRACL